MRKRFPISVLALASTLGMLWLATPPAAAQGNAAAAKAKWARDFNGVWSPIAAQQDISENLLPGEEISLTPFAAQQYNKIDEADSPAYKCEPYGPTRIMVTARGDFSKLLLRIRFFFPKPLPFFVILP